MRRSAVRALAAALTLGSALTAAQAAGGPYPLSPADLCGSTQTCATVLDRWNTAAWNDLIDDSFHLGPEPLAAVRWYTTEGQCTGTLCTDQLNTTCTTDTLDAAQSRFCGVTDEFSNVLLAHAMGSDRAHYDKLHRFAERLRVPGLNGLQCWMYYVQGDAVYTDWSDLCVMTATVNIDSASDASLRILGAYAVACAKQQAGLWTGGDIDYCADYLEQGNAVWGRGTPLHGEIKLLANGEYFLANGFNNQAGAPTNADAIRPDYYELQFLMDFAQFVADPALEQGVLDMLEDYQVSLGDNHIHRGRTGHFDAATTTYTCDQLCSPPYMDNIDTWRVVPVLGGLLNVHRAEVPAGLVSGIFDVWWSQYSGGHPTLWGPTSAKPFEIYAQSSDGGVKLAENSYKTLGMWIPLAAAYDAGYTRQAVDYLVDSVYDAANEQFFGAAYYGGYYSQFAQRALGAASGMIDPAFWRAQVFTDGFESGDVSTWSSAVP